MYTASDTRANYTTFEDRILSNNLSLVGRVGKDSELKQVGQHQLLEFSLAGDTGFGDKKVTSWFNCAIWGDRAEKLEQHITKGKQVYVSGELTLRKYTSKAGKDGVSADLKVAQLDFVGGKEE